MDPLIDYAQYDHWKTNTPYDHDYYENPSTDADRYVDWVFIVYRFRLSDMFPSINYTGYTPIPDYTSQDMILGQPVKIGGWGRGSAQGGMRESGFNGITHVCLHELAHALFPYGHNGRLAGLSVLSANQVGWGTSIWGMNAWEREKLTWMNYNTVASDEIVTLPDYMTNFTALKIPTSSPNRFYVIENRQRLDPELDTAYGKGIYVYRAINRSNNEYIESSEIYSNVNLPEPNGFYDGCINVLSADGRWNFSHNLSPSPNYSIDLPANIRIQKSIPNPRGYDERDYCGRFQYGNTGNWGRYYCLNDRGEGGTNRWYQGDSIEESDLRGDAFGDVHDGFSMGYNRVFSKWSNPGIDQSWADCNFSIEILSENPQTGAVTLRLRFANPQEAPLARPMGLSGTSSNGISYALNWDQPGLYCH